MKVRSDAWTHEDDLLLAETVLRYIREGGTQLQAFEEVGDQLNRTSAACGFRWNAEVRRLYEPAISIAKKQRKERKRAIANSTPAAISKEVPFKVSQTVASHPREAVIQQEAPIYKEEVAREFVPPIPVQRVIPPNNHNLSIEQVISFLTTLKHQGTQGNQLKMENERIKSENIDLKKKNEELQRKVQQLSEQHTMIQEDYQALVQIMDRARRMVMFEETEERQSPVFRMDKNGNLEKVAK
ncbi:RsfA family transcriptional regulator [Bacillus sp. DJP31]|uniref:RsfA family transcriptional regulator n=1 Tax=Bacillus sp. DJP31 TaxID=3409789 RepID=UPI003BB6F202